MIGGWGFAPLDFLVVLVVDTGAPSLEALLLVLRVLLVLRAGELSAEAFVALVLFRLLEEVDGTEPSSETSSSPAFFFPLERVLLVVAAFSVVSLDATERALRRVVRTGGWTGTSSSSLSASSSSLFPSSATSFSSSSSSSSFSSSAFSFSSSCSSWSCSCSSSSGTGTAGAGALASSMDCSFIASSAVSFSVRLGASTIGENSIFS
mmetsp:Transcript_22329/g.55200  ORF Transcript_22329/g.55200 Transcript_22329/m.55200 type:complete len:207 (+) Transcript_22329:1673-2293(+)